jgi:thioredoxin 1
MQNNISTTNDFNEFISNNSGAVVYFSTPKCNVCKVLKPKLIELLNKNFPLMKFAYVDCDKAKELAAQNNIFTVPTILFFFDRKELFRKSRNIGLSEIEEDISRPYNLFFS